MAGPIDEPRDKVGKWTAGGAHGSDKSVDNARAMKILSDYYHGSPSDPRTIRAKGHVTIDTATGKRTVTAGDKAAAAELARGAKPHVNRDTVRELGRYEMVGGKFVKVS